MAERHPVTRTEFRILGPLEVERQGRLLDLGRPKQRAVLGLLLLHAGAVVSLEHLVDELWGEEPPAQAVASLQAYVSHLRRLLEPDRSPRAAPRLLVSRPPGYRLAAAPGDLDAARFEALAAEGRRLLAGGEPESAETTLGRALALWRGDVLADLPEIGRGDRARLEELRLTAIEDRMSAGLALGRAAAVVAELDRLVAAHPYRESLHGLRMLALYRAGRQADALDAFRTTRDLLARDLGVEPGPALELLHRRILGHAPDLESPATPAAAAVPPAAAPARLVGRAEQLAVLRRAVDDAVAGRGGVVLVDGEPGVGKTSLAEELMRRVGGVTVAWGRCAEEPGAPPFWPWSRVLAALGEAAPTAGGDPAGADVAGADGPPVADVEAVRFRQCRAVLDALLRRAAGGPLLIVLDDLHWADAGSLRLLPMLAAEIDRAPIAVVATYRADHDRRLAGTLAALARLRIERIRLAGLSRDEVRQLMAARLGVTPDERLAGVVHDRSAGHPFFVVELTRLLGSERRLAAAQQAAAHAVPQGVRDVLRRRIAALPEQTQAILLVAAVVGPQFDLAVVRDVSGLDDEAALTAVEAALLSGLVHEDQPVGRFRFAHSMVMEHIYLDTSRLRRARLHARVAQRLGERAATHWWRAAPVVGVRVALPHLLAAADAALGVLAHEEAGEHLRHALELLAGEPRSADHTRSELAVQLRLGTLHAQLDGARSPAGRAAVHRACELAADLADPSAMIAAHRTLYELAVARAEHTRARELAGQMVTMSRTTADRALAHLAVGRSLWCLGEPAAAREALDRALELAVTVPATPHENLPVDVTVRLQLATVLDLLGEADEADVHLVTAIDATRDAPPLVRAGVFTNAALIAGLRRDAPAAGEHAGRALDLAGSLPSWFSYATAVRWWARAVDGDPAAGARGLRESLEQIRSRGARHLVGWVLGLLAEAELAGGHTAEAVRLLDEAVALAAATGERLYEAELHRLRDRAGVPGAREAALTVAHAQGATMLLRRLGHGTP